MKTNDMWQWLQMFAGEGGAGASGASGAAAGDGGAPAATGDSADAAGQRLRELGVPESKIRKSRARASALPQNAYRSEADVQEQQAQQAAAAEEKTEDTNQPKTEEVPARMSWEEIMKDPEYNKEMQALIQKRLKSNGMAEDALAALAPALKKLAEENGLDPENMDYVALGKVMSGDYDKAAADLGVSREVAMQMDQQKRTLENQRFAEHIAKMEAQAEAMKTVFPNFDLRAEMKNPVFSRLTSPNMGMSVEDAYYAVHRKELQTASMQVAAQQAAKQISASIASGSRRPDENGAGSRAPSVTAFNYRNASKQQRDELKARIRQAAARGEKIYPGR